jgi:hypothetical protein
VRPSLSELSAVAVGRGALLGIERRLTRITDYFLANGTVVRKLGAAGGARRILAFLPLDAAVGSAGITGPALNGPARSSG